MLPTAAFAGCGPARGKVFGGAQPYLQSVTKRVSISQWTDDMNQAEVTRSTNPCLALHKGAKADRLPKGNYNQSPPQRTDRASADYERRQDFCSSTTIFL